MTVACVLAVAPLLLGEARPRPAPYSWVNHASRTGNSELDAFCIKAVGSIRRDDWEATAALCRRTVSFDALTAVSGAAAMLFDDTVSNDDEPIADYEVKSVRIDTSDDLTLFQRSQFSYFAALVEGSSETSTSVPRWGLRQPSGLSKFGSGPAIWGRHASNASWRVELDHDSGSWKIARFVVETK